MDAIATEEIKGKFIDFYNAYYLDKINDMYISYPKKRSILLDIKDLEKFDVDLASELISNPDEILPKAHEALSTMNPNPEAK